MMTDGGRIICLVVYAVWCIPWCLLNCGEKVSNNNITKERKKKVKKLIVGKVAQRSSCGAHVGLHAVA
jgi:hypothetical protein